MSLILPTLDLVIKSSMKRMRVSLASKPMPLTKPTPLTKPLTKPPTKPLTKPLTKPTPLGVGGINEADESVIGLQLPNVELLVFIKALFDLQQPQESVNL